MSDHPLLTAVGVVAVALGVLMVVEPGLAAAIAADYTAVVLVGALALVQGLRVAQARRAAELRGAETPDVETVRTVPTPGDGFDDRLATLRSGPRRAVVRERADIRESLTDAAVAAVADRDHCSRERARERVEDGTWTDDPFAASFLGGADAPTPPLSAKLKLVATAESADQVRVRRTADAVARAAGVEASDDTPADSPEETEGEP